MLAEKIDNGTLIVQGSFMKEVVGIKAIKNKNYVLEKGYREIVKGV